MTIQHMKKTEFEAFLKERGALKPETFLPVERVDVYATPDGMIVAVTQAGRDGPLVIGDSVGVGFMEMTPADEANIRGEGA